MARKGTAPAKGNLTWPEIAALRLVAETLAQHDMTYASVLQITIPVPSGVDTAGLLRGVIEREIKRQPKTPEHTICDNCGEEGGDKTKPITGHYQHCILCLSGFTEGKVNYGE